VHRIGRTGRAGNEGAAVSFVCMDEEGWMQEIERFTKQRIPAVVVPGFEAEPGEKGEPIAMGRQTIWGGAGKPPSRDVMLAAAKAARQEMMQRIRDNKAADGERGSRNGPGKAKQPQSQRNANGNGARNANGNGARNGARNGNGARDANYGGNGSRQGAARAPQGRPANDYATRNGDDMQPRDGAHNSSSPFVQRDAAPVHTDGQPNPLRTSVDSMGGRRGNGGRSNRGGGYAPRNPARTFGR
jgi:ATP-dependent RNA helicase RhlE